MAESWPGTVPSTLQRDGYSETVPDNLIRTQMDIGPEKVRRRSTAAPRPIRGSIVMTTAEAALFDTFYVTTLADGSLTFNLAHPRTGTTEEMRFTAAPRYEPFGAQWKVVLEMEVLA